MLTLEEQERQAYITGDVKTAALLAACEDLEEGPTSDEVLEGLRKENAGLVQENERLENLIALV